MYVDQQWDPQPQKHNTGSTASTSSRIPKAAFSARPIAPRSPCRTPHFPAHGGARAASTAIYFLLAGDQFSAFHRIRSDELWHFYAGSGLVVHVIQPGGDYQQLLLGSNANQGEQFQAVVPAGCWFGSSLRQPDTYALVGCTVAPGFDFADFEMAKRETLAAQFPQHRNIIARLTRA